MANLTRYNPFSELARFDPAFPELGDFFKGFGLRPVLREFEAEPQMRVEVEEDDKNYMIKAEIPGVKKEDIQLTVSGNRVSISAETKHEKEEREGKKLLRSERYYGQISRSFTLDEEVDQSNAQAKYADGVLELTLPKKSGSAVSKIEVS